MSEGIAQGLYLEASAIDHSCVPNAVWSYQGKEMIIRTIDNVEDFSDLRISYLLKLYENTSRRRQKLLKEYYFLCQCSRCLDFESDQLKSSVLCSKCLTGCVPIKTGLCVDCNYQINDFIMEEHKILKNQISNFVSDYEKGNVTLIYISIEFNSFFFFRQQHNREYRITFGIISTFSKNLSPI